MAAVSAPIQKLNILIYSGPGASASCIGHATRTLSALLTPTYAVGPITTQALLKEPWQAACALLVFPGGADSPYCDALAGNNGGTRQIVDYVRRGGRYLGFCAGGYFACDRCEFEVGDKVLEVVGRRELGLFPGTCRGGAFKGFQYRSEVGARAAKIRIEKGAFQEQSDIPENARFYFNGGGVFVDAAKKGKNVEILATYDDNLDVDGGDGKAAVVYCTQGDGAAILTGPHPEFAASYLSKQPNIPGYDDLLKVLDEDDHARIAFLRACLTKLGLKVNPETGVVPALTELHLSALQSTDVGELLQSLEEVIIEDGSQELINGENNIFHLSKATTSPLSMSDVRRNLPNTSDKETTSVTPLVNQIISHEEEWPSENETSQFNHSEYYDALARCQQREPAARNWGTTLLYGEVVTSTNTLMEKNPTLVSKLPTGFTLAATTQIAARGRGSNVWVSPPGSLIFSTVINHPTILAASRPVVFIQYLAAIATVEAIKTYNLGYGGVPVKLKWPNDIYARDPTKPASPPQYVKIGGILSSCSYHQGSYQIVLGIGVNTTNSKPTTSLNALLEALNTPSDAGARDPRATGQSSTSGPNLEPFTVERLLPRILTRLEALYVRFCSVGFSRDIEERYYAHWLHGGQDVILEDGVSGTVAALGVGPTRARVEGITTDWGMLKVRELDATGRPTNRVWALQSDENSFDFWRGLIKRKI